MFKKNSMAGACCIALLACGAAFAQSFPTGKLFDLTVGVNSTYQPTTDRISGGIQSGSAGFSTVAQMFDNANSAGLSAVNAAYNSNAASVIRIGYAGLPLLITTSQGSSAVTFSVPALNQVTVFNAQSTRDGNVQDLRNYLKSSGGAVLNQIQQLLVKLSPVNPIAGNPNSLQSIMAAGDFDRNFTSFATNIKDGSGSSSSNLIGIGASYGNFTQGGITSQNFTVPLSYTFRADLDPRRQLTLYAPISVTTTAGARSYAGNFGASYRMPITDEWALTPGVGYGLSASVDQGSAASMMAASLTSQYAMRLSGFDLAIGNMVALSQSRKFTAGGYSFDPSVRNTVLRNGVLASFPTSIAGDKMALEVSYINTLFSGTDLYSKQYNEFGLTIGTNKSATSARSFLRGGITYLQGQNGIKGLRLNFGYWF